MKTITLMICLALAAFAQAPAPELDCSAPRFGAADSVGYCEIREPYLWFTGGVLTVKNEGSGSITVLPWDEPGVQVRAQVLTGAQTEWQAESLAAQVEIDAWSGAVVVRGPRTGDSRTWSVNLQIRVPRGARLTLQTVNGNISVQDVEGAISAVTVNGCVTLTRVPGDVIVRVTNGVIRVEVDRWHAQIVDARTVNGGIELDLPRDTSARVNLSAVAGSISADFAGVHRTESGVGQKVSFDLGAGDAQIRAELVTGYIRLREAVYPKEGL